MRRAVIVQARTSSTRLPGKVLADLGGRPLLERQLERLARCRSADEVVVATTTNPGDDAIAELAARAGVRCVRGDEHDVLSRYLLAAREARADLVVRVTSDCPLIDAAGVDAVADALAGGPPADYAANFLERHLPRGLDAEALWSDVLQRADRLAGQGPGPAREHVTWLCHSGRPELFVRRAVRSAPVAPHLRWTVDTPEDLAHVRAIWDGMGLGEHDPGPVAIAEWLRTRPDVVALNAGVAQRTI